MKTLNPPILSCTTRPKSMSKRRGLFKLRYASNVTIAYVFFRPVIVFRCSNSFIGIQGDKLNGNRSGYDIFQMTEQDGAYAFKGNTRIRCACITNSKFLLHSPPQDATENTGPCRTTGPSLSIQPPRNTSLSSSSSTAGSS